MCYYFYGSCLGSAFIGPVYDFLLAGSAYLILDLMILGALFFQTIFLFFPSVHDSDLKATLVLYGMSYKIMEFLLTILVPLLVAANRKEKDNLTPSGTMLTVVNVFFYLGIFILYGIVNLIPFAKDQSASKNKGVTTFTTLDRTIIIIIMILSLIPTASLAK
jgi:hypothetical protein